MGLGVNSGGFVMTSITSRATRIAGLALGFAFAMIAADAAAQTTTATSQPGPAPPLEGTYWRAIELDGTPAPVEVTSREAHLVFGAGTRVSGSDGCNRLTGTYDLKGDALTFGQFAVTQMACPDTGDTDRRFRAVLKGTSRFRIVGQRLELYGATGKPLAIFERRAEKPSPAASPPGGAALPGTTWQLVRFQGGDGATLTPDDRTKYTLAFNADGRVSARVDCNRGSATWKSAASSQLELGPLALTRAMCPDGSLHDHIVKQWGAIRSYVIRDGHLFLSLMADGGIYEFEPMSKPPAR